MKFPMQKRKQKSNRQEKKNRKQLKHINGLWLYLSSIHRYITI